MTIKKAVYYCLTVLQLAQGFGLSRFGSMANEALQRLQGKDEVLQTMSPLPQIDSKRKLLEKIATIGRVPKNKDEAAALDDACAAIESFSPAEAIDGSWKVAYATAPFPSSGVLGPFSFEAKQIVDYKAKSYLNQLQLGPGLPLTLEASFETLSETSLRVKFLSLRLGSFLTFRFPEDVERTWHLSYTDPTIRIVRAALDGGKRVLSSAQADESSSLFVLTKDYGTSQSIKSALLAAIQEDEISNISHLIEALAVTAPPSFRDIQKFLPGSFQVLWTTEAELLSLTRLKACQGAFQTIASQTSSTDLSLDNLVDFGQSGFLSVKSSCEPSEALYSRINFQFNACRAQLPFGPAFNLPPLGAGYFDVLYLDKDIRVSKDSRGDLQILKRIPSSPIVSS